MKWCTLFMLILVGCVSPLAFVSAQDKYTPAVSVKITGFIGDRLNHAYDNRILKQDADELIEPFKHREETSLWQSEFWGKWFTSAVLAYRYQPTPMLKQKLDDAVEGLIATQSKDGYIGNYSPAARLKEWDIWGRKYCMLGLLDYYKLTGDKRSLKAAKGIADHLMNELEKADGMIVTKGNYRGMAASSILEPFCLLYTYSKDKKYLAFAEEIVRQWETADGPQLVSKANVDVAKRFPKPANWYSFEQGHKAYEMMSCYEGLLELYRLTGKPAYKTAVETTWQNIKDTEINIAGSGASTEMWFGGRALQTEPVNHYQETCVTVTWIKLSHQLLRLTGEAKYADAVEQSYYNALLGSMSPDGLEWAKYTPLNGLRLPGSGQCGMNINCCVASGPRGLFNIPAYVVMKSAVGLAVNYFIPGTYSLTTPSGKLVELTQETNYPQSGKIELALKLGKSEDFTLEIRIPAWSKNNSIRVNGDTLKGLQSGSFASVKRHWKNGDRLSVELDMRGRVVRMGDKPGYAAIMSGPIVLASDERSSGINFNAIVDLDHNDGYIHLEPIVLSPNKSSWMQFSYTFRPESYKEAGDEPVSVILCDYASVGNGNKPSAFKTWFPQLFDPKKN